MKVLLANPPYVAWKGNRRYLRFVAGLTPPLGVLSLAACLRKHEGSIRLKLIDAPATGMSVLRLANVIAGHAPDVVCLSVVSAAYASSRRLARLVRERLPGVVIVVGGPHITGVGETVLRSAPEFDCAVIGEGEETLLELLRALRERGDVSEVKGIVYRSDDGAVVRTPPRGFVEDLDGLPDPAWDMLEGFPRRYGTSPFFSPGGPTAGLVTSRGCPFRCAFCYQGTFGHRYRALSAGRVADMVERLQRTYGVRYFVFCDDVFTLDRKRLFAICQRLRALRPRPVWSCDAHVKTVDRETLREMHESGCWSIAYGLESGSPEVLASLNKAIDLEEARRTVRETREEGILVKGLFMMGAPEESARSVAETRAFIASLDLSTLNVSKFTPYPGTALYSEIRKSRALDWEKFNGMNFVGPSKHLSVEELEREYKETIRSFYSTPSACKDHMLRAFSRWSNVRRILGVLPGLLDAWVSSGRNGG